MADFAAKIFKVTIKEHKNADLIEIAQIKGYQSIVQKEQFQTGDLVAYIPESSIVPEDVIEELGLTGKLAGSQFNRVKAIKLRGVLSQGLIYPIDGNRFNGHTLSEGQNVTSLLGITKYEPPIPSELSGQVWPAYGKTLKFDIEDIKMHPDVFSEDDTVVITEKIHGTFVAFGRNHADKKRTGWRKWLMRIGRNIWPRRYGEEWIVHSKGLGEKGLAFVLGRANNTCVPVQIFHKLRAELERIEREILDPYPTWFICGEIFGPGVQDLHYSQKEKTFAAFDIFVSLGSISEGLFLNHDDFQHVMQQSSINSVPLLGTGPYSESVVENHTNGKTTFDKKGHVREGVVVKTITEKRDPEIGRKMLKSLSAKHLTRKKGTEHN